MRKTTRILPLKNFRTRPFYRPERHLQGIPVAKKFRREMESYPNWIGRDPFTDLISMTKRITKLYRQTDVHNWHQAHTTLELFTKAQKILFQRWLKSMERDTKYVFQERLDTKQLEYTPLAKFNDTTKPAKLTNGLDRVLFGPGVHFLQDPRTRVFNFPESLQTVPKPREYNIDEISQFIKASKDEVLKKITKSESMKFFSSSSSMTGALKHFHFFLSDNRPANVSFVSKHFDQQFVDFTSGARLPEISVLRKHNLPNHPVWSVDSEHLYDMQNVLSELGHLTERQLTMESDAFAKLLDDNRKGLTKPATTKQVSDSYHYARSGQFVMRSQLDCYDERLPGTGTFDLKSRSASAVRHDLVNVTDNYTGYQLVKTHGTYESFEREKFDLVRGTMLKYSLQARIGNMDGIFLAYHNLEKMFGFEYVPTSEMDWIFHSCVNSSTGKVILDHAKDLDKIVTSPVSYHEDKAQQLTSIIADVEFKASVKIWSKLMELAIEDCKTDYVRTVVFTDEFSELHFLYSPMTKKQLEEGEELTVQVGELVNKQGLDPQKEHMANIRQYNESFSKTLRGFTVSKQHFFNDQKPKTMYPVLSDANVKWDIEYTIRQIPDSKLRTTYDRALKYKREVFETVANKQKRLDPFTKILRAYGEKGRRREEFLKNL